MNSWRRHEIEIEILRRERNEWIEGATDSFGGKDAVDSYVCECGDPLCGESIGLTRLEYESVRTGGTRFAIALNHEDPEIERVVSENNRFAVVQKVAFAARMSQEADPRPRADETAVERD